MQWGRRNSSSLRPVELAPRLPLVMVGVLGVSGACGLVIGDPALPARVNTTFFALGESVVVCRAAACALQPLSHQAGNRQQKHH